MVVAGDLATVGDEALFVELFRAVVFGYSAGYAAFVGGDLDTAPGGGGGEGVLSLAL